MQSKTKNKSQSDNIIFKIWLYKYHNIIFKIWLYKYHNIILKRWLYKCLAADLAPQITGSTFKFEKGKWEDEINLILVSTTSFSPQIIQHCQPLTYVTQPRRGTWPCEPLAWPVPRSSLQSCWARWNLRWQAWDLEESSRTDDSQEGSSRRKRAIDSVQQNSIIGLDVDIMVAAAPGDTNHSIPAIVDEAVQTYLTVSQLYYI